MPRRFRRWLVPLPALIACTLPCAGASAAPQPMQEARVAWAAQADTLSELAERRDDRRARAAEQRDARQDVVQRAEAQIGDPYAYGASGPGAFDCSGLTAYAFAAADVSLPHSSFAQASMGSKIARGDIRRGDLVFFSTAGSGASHVGIAVSRTTVVSATNSGVMKHALDDAYWGGHYVTARRID